MSDNYVSSTAKPQPVIAGYHSHVYFDAHTFEQAESLCKAAAAQVPELIMGRMHQRPVRPHPAWCCPLSCPLDLLTDVLQWLAVHRDGLDILTQPLSAGD